MFSEMFEQFWEANSLKKEITYLTHGEFVRQYYFNRPMFGRSYFSPGSENFTRSIGFSRKQGLI